MTPQRRLRQIVGEKRAVTVPGVANPMFARVVEGLGFECLYVSGAGVANMQVGVPDIGLVSVTEMAASVAAIADQVSLPIIADADTGYGNALNACRTMRLFEKAGVSAIQFEDQVFPKKCGHFAGKAVIPEGEMVQKIKAIADARVDGDIQIIARTDAIATEGFERAMERAMAYVEAGADMTFIEAPTSTEQMSAIGSLTVPQVANIVFGGKTPDPGREALRSMGFSIVLYANAVLQAALRASSEVLTSLRDTGSLEAVAPRLASFTERQSAVAKEEWDALEAKYVYLATLNAGETW